MLFLVVIQPAQVDTWPSCLRHQNREFSNTVKETVIGGFILTDACWTIAFIQTYSVCVIFIGLECNSLP